VSDSPFTTPPATPAPLALRPKQAAAALGISPRKLWELTNIGAVPHVRLGRAIVYPVSLLERWLSEQAAGRTNP
jgi:predicted DNA-binding transcriptional regulator AlpA